MPCEWYQMPGGGVVHIKRGRSGAKKHCKFCRASYKADDGKLCDFPVGNGKTCDAEMCGGCARTLGKQHTDAGHGMKRLNDTIDVCPIHRAAAAVRDGKIQLRRRDGKYQDWKETK